MARSPVGQERSVTTTEQGMVDVARKRSPRVLARLTGGLYLYIMVAAMFAEALVRGKLIAPGDAAATVRNIASSAGLWRWGVAAEVSTTLCDVAVAALLFILLRPVDRTMSLGAAFFRLVYSATMAASAAFLVAPLLLLDTPHGPASADVQLLVSYSLHLHGAAFDIALTLFGVHLALVGALIARSTFLPRLLGAALTIAGICYTANSFIDFIAPTFADKLFPWILLPGFLAEGALTLWFLIAGVNEQRWFASGAEADAG